jgi:hypothetical protein
MLAPMVGNVIISEVDARTYVVLSEVDKHVPYGELVSTREFLTLYTRCRTNRGRLAEFNCICIACCLL